jgi:hypothetical protein
MTDLENLVRDTLRSRAQTTPEGYAAGSLDPLADTHAAVAAVRSRAIHLRRRRLAGQAAATLVAVAAVGGSVVFAGSRLTGSDPAGAIQPAGRPTTAVITGTAAPSATAPRPSTSAGPAQTISPSLVAAYRARLGEQDARATSYLTGLPPEQRTIVRWVHQAERDGLFLLPDINDTWGCGVSVFGSSSEGRYRYVSVTCEAFTMTPNGLEPTMSYSSPMRLAVHGSGDTLVVDDADVSIGAGSTEASSWSFPADIRARIAAGEGQQERAVAAEADARARLGTSAPRATP